MFWRKQLRCSFCRKHDSEVQKLVAGPRVYICDECVTIAKRLMDKETGPIDERTSKPSIVLKIRDRLRRLLLNTDTRKELATDYAD